MKERNPLKTSSSWHSRKKEEIRQEETIAAISTPVGESGIGIVRMSGPFAEGIAKHIFRSSKNLPALRSHQFHYGEVFDPETGKTVDEVMLVLMKSPHTYTREDIVEIQCHGGYFLPERILELVVRQGARIAEPGEFTKRAFLNGRIDLTQAEAVIDLIKARTETSLELAQQQLKGRLYKEVHEIKSIVLKQLALIEAHIDFPEEEIETISVEGVTGDLAEVEARLGEWIDSFEEGRVFREGIRCAIVGRTNVGKSSLLNAMLKEERAIVTAVPGTTRDVIEEVMDIHGLPVRLIDTAGLRESADLVEQEGVRRARERLSDADLALVVVDGSRPLEQDDLEIFREVEIKKKIIVMNKCDLAPVVGRDEIEGLCGAGQMVSVSALRGNGIDKLKETVYALVVHREVRSTPEYLIVANVRHKAALTRARDGVSRAERGLSSGIPLELIAVEMRYALDALGDLVGETTREDVLNVIFDQFCIGK